MPKLNTTVKSVRLDNDILAELEKRLNGKTYNAWLNEKIAEELGRSSQKIEPVQVNPIENHSEAYSDLVSMLDCYGLTMEQFILEADRCMNEGLLTFEGDAMLCALPEWAVRLEEACEELGYDVDKIVDSAVKSLKQL